MTDFTGFGLASVMTEGEVWVRYPTCELSGKKFLAFKGLNKQFTGLSMVVRKLKSGLYACVSIDGSVNFKETKKRILAGIDHFLLDEICSKNGFKTHAELFGEGSKDD